MLSTKSAQLAFLHHTHPLSMVEMFLKSILILKEILIFKPSLTIKTAERYFKRFHDRDRFCSRKIVAVFMAGSPKGWQEAWQRYFWQKIFLKRKCFHYWHNLLWGLWKEIKVWFLFEGFRPKLFLSSKAELFDFVQL